MRYLVFGGLTTVINTVIFIAFDASGKFPVIVSNSVAWLVAVVFAYFTNRYCVFNSKKNKKSDIAKELTSFVGSRIFTFFVESILMVLTIERFGWNSILMKIIINIIVIILNYILSKVIVFKEKPQN